MFRDSHGVVHTVCSADPLQDLPADTAAALARGLLRPAEPDLAGELERCEAVRELVEQWQDAFFAALPEEVDREEEQRWAAEAGLSLDDLEQAYEDEDEQDPEHIDLDLAADHDPELDPDVDDLDDLSLAALDLPGGEHDPRRRLPEDLVTALERGLLLLPLRVRLEALVAAASLVGDWSDLLADHEKLLGHLVLAHAEPGAPAPHERLWDRHAQLHAASGPGHG